MRVGGLVWVPAERYGWQMLDRQVDELLARTPYLIADGPEAVARFGRVAQKALSTHERAKAAAELIAQQAVSLLGPYESAMRSDLVAESNRLEGYSWSAKEVRELVRVNNDLLRIEVHNFVEHIRDDSRLMEGLGLYRAYAIADDWAKAEERPREFELRSLHSLIMGSDPGAGRYKTYDNEIQGSEHTPVSLMDVPKAMHELSGWFTNGTGDPVLDAAVVHAWLTHVHPFEDGNGRMARLLANLALVQSGFPPLLLRSSADRGPYLEALAASDDGDILPLYDLFARSLRRAVKTMERPDFVQSKVRGELLDTAGKRYRLWRESIQNWLTCLQHKIRPTPWNLQYMGVPSEEDFVQLENLSPDGNCWFVKLRDSAGIDQWLFFFGFRTNEMRDLYGGQPNQRCWPSIFAARRTNDPRSVHPWEPLFQAEEADQPDELSIAPASQKEITARWGLRSEEYDIVDGASLIVKAFCR